MRSANLIAVFVLAAAALCACSSRAAPTTVPTVRAVPTSIATIQPDATTRVGETDVFCPTLDDRAWKLYSDAVILEGLGKLEDAKELYQQVIELDPAFCDAMDNLGRLLRSQGQLDEAIYWYRESIEVLPDNSVAHQNLAVALRMQGRIAEAIEEYQLLVQIDPDDPEGYYGLAQSHLDLGEPHKAVTQAEKAEALYARRSSPFIVDARHLLGIAYLELEDCGKALEYLNMIYPEMQNDPGVNYFLGVCLLIESRDSELARKYLDKAQELGVDIPPEVLLELDK